MRVCVECGVLYRQPGAKRLVCTTASVNGAANADNHRKLEPSTQSINLYTYTYLLYVDRVLSFNTRLKTSCVGQPADASGLCRRLHCNIQRVQPLGRMERWMSFNNLPARQVYDKSSVLLLRFPWLSCHASVAIAHVGRAGFWQLAWCNLARLAAFPLAVVSA